MIREVVQIGNPVLRETCKPITRFDYELAALLDDLKDTVKREQGAGLAAPQIGVPVRVAVVDVDEGFFEFVNPVFVWQKGEQVGPEGCLSVRGKVGTVRRPDKVKIIFQDRKGDKYSLAAFSPERSAMSLTISTGSSIPIKQRISKTQRNKSEDRICRDARIRSPLAVCLA
jgi:peptide deformylase